MKTNKKYFSFPVLSALTLLLAGCPRLQEPIEVVLKPDATKQQNNATSKRFQEVAPTAVDSAIELSKKNTELFEQMTELRQANQELTDENHQLKDRIAVLEPELTQVKKELNEANDLLIEMRIELNNWKTDILGFRSEIRDADKAQLEALLRVLEILGGEVRPEPSESEGVEVSQEQNQDSTAVSTNGQS